MDYTYLHEKAYAAYQLHWLATSGITVERLCWLAQTWGEAIHHNGVSPRDYPFVEAIDDAGLSDPGQPRLMWPDMEDFMENGYKDAPLMHMLLMPDLFADYAEEHGKIKVFRYPEDGKEDDPQRLDYIKYWSNSVGELHHYGEYSITEAELPEELSRAYAQLWSDAHGNPCYLVETPKGYGVALICEYACPSESDNWAEDMAMQWEAVRADAAIISMRKEFATAEIVLSEYGAVNEAHELAIIFPANTQTCVFTEAATLLNELAFASS